MGLPDLGSIRCECGQLLTVRMDSRLAFCSCGARNVVGCIEPYREETHKKKLPCQHRGPSAGKASCGCGTVFHCSFTGGYCGDRDVVEFATLGEDVLTKENYRRCASCSEFVAGGIVAPKESGDGKEKQPVHNCSTCGKPSTRICGEHSSFGMCGMPICDNCKCRLHGWG